MADRMNALVSMGKAVPTDVLEKAVAERVLSGDGTSLIEALNST